MKVSVLIIVTKTGNTIEQTELIERPRQSTPHFPSALCEQLFR